MARCPFATFRGSVPNETPHGMIAHRGLVLHVQQGQEAGTDSWFHNPAAKASAHFGVGVDGALDQWVDTDDKAWAEAAGNPSWVSVEIAGYSGQLAAPAQVATLGRLYAWLASLYGFPYAATDDPNGAGLGWHGMGGQAWGGHLDCPGEPIKAQRPQILAGARPAPAPAPAPPAPAPPMEATGMNLATEYHPCNLPLDAQGHGWIDVAHDFSTVAGLIVQGSSPPDDGYWVPVTVEAQPRNGATRIDFYGAPGQQAGVFVKVLTP